MSTLVIVAHPDDESFSMGGTIARLASRGESVTVVTCADGVGSRFRPGQHRAHLRAKRERDAACGIACTTLGVSHAIRLSLFLDQQADRVPQLTINRGIEALLAEHDTDATIYTHHPGDLNLDHRRVAEAVLVATRGQGRRVYAMRPEWPARCVGPAWAPDEVWDIRPWLDVKVAACHAYTAETRPFPHPRSEQAIRDDPTEGFMTW